MKTAIVTKIPTSHIGPNPHNPRRLFDEEPMKILRESIEKLGVLVPITVYPLDSGAIFNPRSSEFAILDGERRWRCVVELGHKNIPAIIVGQPTEEQNILTMFHIHNLREGWQLMPTALKLQTLMEKLQERNERKLAELTKLTISQVRRCKILLTYQKKFQNMMLAPPSDRLKSDFFIDLQRIRGPALEHKFPLWVKRGDAACIDTMLRKYHKDVIKNVTEFRILAEVYRGAEKTHQMPRFYKELERFLEVENVKIEDIDVPGATFEKDYKEINRSANRLLTQLRDMDPDVLAANEDAVDVLRKLSKLIGSKLEDAMLVEPRGASSEPDRED